MSTTSLHDRLWSIVTREAPIGCKAPVEVADTRPFIPKGEFLTTFEIDLRDWGLLCGLAYGIARADDPFESDHSVVERAREAAMMVWERWSGWHVTFREDRERRPVPDDYDGECSRLAEAVS